MSEPKFTEGPLQVMPWTSADLGDCFRIMAHASPVFRGFTKIIAAVQREQDAVLYAAAPSLYYALEQILDDMGEDGLCVCPAAKEQAIAALKKARGEL